MQVQLLSEKYRLNTAISELITHLNQNNSSPKILSGAKGSLPALIAAGVWNKVNTPHVFLLNDSEEAAYFYNDLQQFIDKNDLAFFPASYRNPYETEEVQNANVLARTEIIAALVRHKKKNHCLLSRSDRRKSSF